jgi:hypothetical protein
MGAVGGGDGAGEMGAGGEALGGGVGVGAGCPGGPSTALPTQAGAVNSVSATSGNLPGTLAIIAATQLWLILSAIHSARLLSILFIPLSTRHFRIWAGDHDRHNAPATLLDNDENIERCPTQTVC